MLQDEGSAWTKLKTPRFVAQRQETGVDVDTLKKVGKALHTVPEGFKVHRVLAKQMKMKETAMSSGQGIDWATGEALAIGTLLLEGNKARLTGQDVERGTFSHRHALVHVLCRTSSIVTGYVLSM